MKYSRFVYLKDLHPPVWEVDLAADGGVGVEGPEPARAGAGVTQTYRGVNSVSFHRPSAHVKLREGMS